MGTSTVVADKPSTTEELRQTAPEVTRLPADTERFDPRRVRTFDYHRPDQGLAITLWANGFGSLSPNAREYLGGYVVFHVSPSTGLVFLEPATAQTPNRYKLRERSTGNAYDIDAHTLFFRRYGYRPRDIVGAYALGEFEGKLVLQLPPAPDQ